MPLRVFSRKKFAGDPVPIILDVVSIQLGSDPVQTDIRQSRRDSVEIFVEYGSRQICAERLTSASCVLPSLLFVDEYVVVSIDAKQFVDADGDSDVVLSFRFCFRENT